MLLEQAEAVRVDRPHERCAQPVERLRRRSALLDAGRDPGLQFLCGRSLGERERDGKTAGSRTSRSRRICTAEHPVRLQLVSDGRGLGQRAHAEWLNAGRT